MANILILCSHTDDEINMAGTINRHIEVGDNVKLLAFSTGNGKTGTHKSEFALSMTVLKIDDHHLYDFKTRYFPVCRQEILQILCNESKPDIVYGPCTWDCHQDHQVVTNEMIRAFRTSSIYGYEILHNDAIGSQLTHYVKLERKHLELKNRLAQCYESQKERLYMKPGHYESLMRVRGHQVSMPYAEAFETIRSIKE